MVVLKIRTISSLAVLFLLREVEVSTARLSAWTFDHAATEVTWFLLGSKTDHMALGVRRSWACLCDVPELACPYHLATEHLEWLRASAFGNSPHSPPFPSTSGGMAAKEAVVVAFECIGLQLGQPIASTILPLEHYDGATTAANPASSSNGLQDGRMFGRAAPMLPGSPRRLF